MVNGLELYTKEYHSSTYRCFTAWTSVSPVQIRITTDTIRRGRIVNGLHTHGYQDSRNIGQPSAVWNVQGVIVANRRMLSTAIPLA